MILNFNKNVMDFLMNFRKIRCCFLSDNLLNLKNLCTKRKNEIFNPLINKGIERKRLSRMNLYYSPKKKYIYIIVTTI